MSLWFIIYIGIIYVNNNISMLIIIMITSMILMYFSVFLFEFETINQLAALPIKIGNQFKVLTLFKRELFFCLNKAINFTMRS